MSEAVTLPSPFISVDERTPRNSKPVLGIRRSAYNSCNFEVLTVRYDAEYRPLSPWVDISNDSVTDSGNEILGWTEAGDWLNA